MRHPFKKRGHAPGTRSSFIRMWVRHPFKKTGHAPLFKCAFSPIKVRHPFKKRGHAPAETYIKDGVAVRHPFKKRGHAPLRQIYTSKMVVRHPFKKRGHAPEIPYLIENEIKISSELPLILKKMSNTTIRLNHFSLFCNVLFTIFIIGLIDGFYPNGHFMPQAMKAFASGWDILRTQIS